MSIKMFLKPVSSIFVYKSTYKCIFFNVCNTDIISLTDQDKIVAIHVKCISKVTFKFKNNIGFYYEHHVICICGIM